MFIKYFIDTIKDVFKRIPGQLKKSAAEALLITSNIKQFLQSPVADAIVSIIPGQWDDKARTAILATIDQVLPCLKIVDTCNEAATTEDKLKCWVTELSKLAPDVQDAYLHKLGSLLIAVKDGNKLKQSLYDYYLQVAYISGKKF